MSRIDNGTMKNELNGLLEMYEASLNDELLSSANIHVQLAFAIADLRDQQNSNQKSHDKAKYSPSLKIQ